MALRLSSIIASVIAITSFNASAIKLDRFDFYAGAYVGSYSVHDPAGDTNNDTSSGLFAGSYYQLDRKTFIKSEFFYTGASPKGSATKIGQDYKAWGVINEYQYEYVYSRKIRPRFGAGVATFYGSASKRYLEDGHNYLGQRFEDKAGLKFGVTVSVENKFTPWDIPIIAGIRYQQGINSLSIASLNLAYQF